MAYIGEIVKQATFVRADTTSGTVDEMFRQQPDLQGIVILADDGRTGLVTRTSFYQKIGTRYGYNLYLNRPIDLLANETPLLVDYFASVNEVSKCAMERPDKEVYDDIIVQKENDIAGVVSIKELLLKVADIQVEIASYMNPLTLLPGNYSIDEKLSHLFKSGDAFTVMYIDLDRFKPYNDLHGFKKGDVFLQSTANILKEVFRSPDSFIGHVGGDDFIVTLNHVEFEEACGEVIRRFDAQLPNFYSPEQIARKYIIGENREGETEAIPLVSISIAVVRSGSKPFQSIEELVEEATRIKKICKMTEGSCFYAEPATVH